MNLLQEKVLNTIKKHNLIQKGDNIVIGVSGGPDSMALLHVLYNMKELLDIQIVVAHINHMLRKEADGETKYVQEFCESLQIQCYIKKVDISKQSESQKISTELAGRNARYDFFEEVAQKVNANKIATAHNANDNAETVMMNLIRGSGVSGLKGIEPIRDNKLIRPIIECTRKEIEKYCEENRLNPKYDKSNSENIYTRNKIRNKLLPYIEEEFNPNIIESLNRLSTIVSKEEAYFHKNVEKLYEELKVTGDNLKDILNDINIEANQDNVCVLDLKKFNQLEEVIKSRLILYTINELMGSSQGIEKIHIEDIIKLCGNNIGNKYLTPNKNIKIYVKKGKIIFIDLNN